MSQTVRLDDAANRALKHLYQDGLVELGLGLLMIASVSLGWIEDALPQGSAISDLYLWLGVPLSIVAFLGIHRAAKRVRATVVFPRSGYVAFNPSKSASRIRWGMVAAVVLVTCGLALLPAAREGGLAHLDRVMGLGVALTFSLFFLLAGLKLRIVNLVWLAAYSVLLGVSVCLLYEGLHPGRIVTGGLGAALVVDGGWSFKRFLSSNPKVEDTP
jgi:hypothetical protein